MKVVRCDEKVIVKVTDDPPEHSTRPSVDYLFRWAIKAYAGEALGVIMTGMGRDGAAGCRQLKRQQGYVIAQHAKDCTVYGMPKAVIEEDLPKLHRLMAHLLRFMDLRVKRGNLSI